jgi:hypothetical protein
VRTARHFGWHALRKEEPSATIAAFGKPFQHTETITTVNGAQCAPLYDLF